MVRRDSTVDYRFVDRWRVRGTVQEVSDILADVTSYPRWWPSTYIEVTDDVAGDENDVGRSGRVYAQGWLPYRIRFNYRVTESRAPRGFSFAAWGDLTGNGVWDLVQDGDWVDVTFTWTIRADKPILRSLSVLLKPIFRSNHGWTMRRGEPSLQLELERRRAATPDSAAGVPDPPGPFPRWVWGIVAGAVILALWSGGRRMPSVRQ
jgi:hypothetical protein